MVSYTDPTAQMSGQSQITPQGVLGPTLGNILGSTIPFYGQPQYGSQVQNWPQYFGQQQITPQFNPLANWSQTVNPYSATTPYYNPQQQIAPQGAIGQQIGGLLGSLLPFQAQPQYNPMQQFAPQGVTGQQLGSWAGAPLPFNQQAQFNPLASWGQGVSPIGQYQNQLQQITAHAIQAVQAAQHAVHVAQAAQAACGQQLSGLIGSLLPFHGQSQINPLANWQQTINPLSTISPYSNLQSQWTRPYTYGPAQTWA